MGPIAKKRMEKRRQAVEALNEDAVTTHAANNNNDDNQNITVGSLDIGSVIFSSAHTVSSFFNQLH